MADASRIVVVPPERWDEERLLAAARTLTAPDGPVRPGDDVGGLVVVRVEPEPGATASARTPVEVDPTPRPVGGRTLDVVVLLDASESMGQPWSPKHTRWSGACEALRAFLADPGHHLRLVSLFIYARNAQLIAGPVASSDVKIPELTPRGRSMTGTALNATLAYLAENASPESQQSVLILSDGAGETQELERAAARAARLRVPVHALVFAPADDTTFQHVAHATGGSAQRATMPPSFALVYEPTQETSP